MKTNYSIMYLRKNQNLFKTRKMHSRIKTEISINSSKNNIFLNLSQYKSKGNNISNYKCYTESNISTIKYNKSKNSILSKISLNKIIDSYERSIISLFDLIKNLFENNIYLELKQKFKIEFENNLKSKNKEEKDSSNSIRKIINETLKKYTNINSNSQSKNNLELTPSFIKTKPHTLLIKNERNHSPYQSNQKNTYTQIQKYNSYSNKNRNSKSTQNTSSINSINKFSFNRELLFNQNKINISIHKKNSNNFKNIINDNNINNNNTYNNNINININNINDMNEKNNKNELECNNELLSKIKESLDDTLKNMFTFSYEHFLNKESERLDKK